MMKSTKQKLDERRAFHKNKILSIKHFLQAMLHKHLPAILL